MIGFIFAFVNGMVGWYLGLVAYQATGNSIYVVASFALLLVAIISIVTVILDRR